MFIPFLNLVIGILELLGIAERFGKGAGFALGLFFLPAVFYPILGLGGAQYQLPGERQHAQETPNAGVAIAVALGFTVLFGSIAAIARGNAAPQSVTAEVEPSTLVSLPDAPDTDSWNLAAGI